MKHIIISKIKSKQTRKFSQLIIYNVKIIFLSKIVHEMYLKSEIESLLLKELSISLNQYYELLCSLILLYVQVEVFQNML